VVPEAYSAESRINRHGLNERFLEVFELFAVRIIAAGLSGAQKSPLSGAAGGIGEEHGGTVFLS
jgi:hypothetical protein